MHQRPCYGTCASRLGGIGDVVGFENLYVGAEFEFKSLKIGTWTSGHDGVRTHGFRDAIDGREKVKPLDRSKYEFF